jgi:hypothetical protein
MKRSNRNDIELVLETRGLTLACPWAKWAAVTLPKSALEAPTIDEVNRQFEGNSTVQSRETRG